MFKLVQFSSTIDAYLFKLAKEIRYQRSAQQLPPVNFATHAIFYVVQGPDRETGKNAYFVVSWLRTIEKINLHCQQVFQILFENFFY